MSKIKVVFSVLTGVGIVGLTLSGVSAMEIGSMVPIYFGIGTALAAAAAIFKKR